jgi:predicted RNase H-like nuclease (RuvC/YqgF family)
MQDYYLPLAIAIIGGAGMCLWAYIDHLKDEIKSRKEYAAEIWYERAIEIDNLSKLNETAAEKVYRLSEKLYEENQRAEILEKRAEILEKIILEAKVLILPESHPDEEVRYAIQDIEYVRECEEDDSECPF